MKIAWTKLAVDDLYDAHDYIAQNSPRSAAGIIELIERGVEALRHHPEIGRSGRVDGTRELVIPGTPFIISYRSKKHRVEILAVIHGARRWPESFPN